MTVAELKRRLDHCDPDDHVYLQDIDHGRAWRLKLRGNLTSVCLLVDKEVNCMEPYQR
jgi:hypothetical protein